MPIKLAYLCAYFTYLSTLCQLWVVEWGGGGTTEPFLGFKD